ncbi:MAG TPA: hypothetical protein VGR38_06980 [Candidatus Polarisedimenticolia bacterium]|jgi:hypothetical protein|nr:hypothetical protein [Candidatus Polarisedimenticolia bacterium]
MLMVLLLAAWVWDRVLLDCSGSQETITNYYFQASILTQVPGTCSTGQGNQTMPCLVWSALPPVPFGPNIGDPGTGTSVSTWFDPVATPQALPEPPVGGLAAWPWPTGNPVGAIDRGGNRTGQTCH